MDIRIQVPAGTDVSALERRVPDMYQDDVDNVDGDDIYFVCMGENEDDYEDDTRVAAEELCGLIETVCPEADALIDGCGAWAQGQTRAGKNYRRGVQQANKKE